VSYTFDLAGQRSLMIEAGGGRFSYAFDNNGRISRLLNPQGLPTTWAYDNADRVTAKYLANGIRASMTWDDANRLQHLANMKSDGTTTSSFDYAYDKADNRLRVVEASGVRVSWAYDKTYQLLHEQRSGSSSNNVTYTYDPAGNRQVKIDGGVRTTYTVDGANQLLTLKDNTGTTTYTWDASGNQATQTAPSGARTTFGWDFENRQTRMLLPAGVPNTMTYDGDGMRVQKQDSAGTTKFIWDEQNILEETDQTNVIQVIYTMEPISYGNLLSQYRSPTSQFFLFDGVGSTDRLTDSMGNITDSDIYKAFGVIQTATGSSRYPFKFVGEKGYYFDSDTSEMYLRARHYDPVTGRFRSCDPILFGPGGLNLYVYVSNDPVGSTDPSGSQRLFYNIVFKGLVVKRINIKWLVIARVRPKDDTDEWGHWWIEIGSKESYGWWPESGVKTLRQMTLGVKGIINDKRYGTGTDTEDPYGGKKADNSEHPHLTRSPFRKMHFGDDAGKPCRSLVNRYCINVEKPNEGKGLSNLQNSIRKCIRAAKNKFISNKNQLWRYPGKYNCHTFQKWLLEQCCLSIRKLWKFFPRKEKVEGKDLPID
jgi:RHS repeat-associated protein